MSWKDDKDLGPWDFTEQPSKWGYVNNPNWTNSSEGVDFAEDAGVPVDVTDRHTPCGHWHKVPVTTKTYYTFQEGSWWQQTADIDSYKIYIGAANYDYEQFGGVESNTAIDRDSIILVSEYTNDDNPLINEEEFDSVSIEPPTIVRCSTYTAMVGLVWGLEDGDGDYTSALVCGVKRSGYDQYWRVVVNKLVHFKDGDVGDTDIAYSYGAEAFDNGIIVICYYYDDYATGNGNLCVIRSTDYGMTWGSEIIVYSSCDDAVNIKKGDDGKLYIAWLDYGNGSSIVRLFISDDYGATWTAKTTGVLGSTPTSPWGVVDHATDANGKIYLVVGRSASFSLYVSSDGGDSWTAYAHADLGRTLNIEANTTAVVIVGSDIAGGTPYHAKIIRSTDGGVNFSEEVDLYTLGETSTSYRTLKHDGSNFLFTYCAMRDANGWISWLASTDHGANWSEDSIPDIMKYSSSETSQQIEVGSIESAEPQIWEM